MTTDDPQCRCGCCYVFNGCESFIVAVLFLRGLTVYCRLAIGRVPYGADLRTCVYMCACKYGVDVTM